MIHFLYFISAAIIISVAFAVFTSGELKEKVLYGLKIFAEFVGVSLILAWIFYFLGS